MPTYREFPPKLYRVAIIGAGNASFAHIRGIQQITEFDVHIAGIHDLDQEKAHEVARHFRLPRVYPDLASILTDDAIDMVAVVTPPASHRELSIQALRAGKHVMCEKPMADSVAECSEMLAAQKDCPGRLFVVQNRIYTDAMRKAREIIMRGDLGSVCLVHTAGIEGAELLTRMPSIKTDPLGVLNTVGVHQTYVIPWLIGQEITSIKASVGKASSTDIKADDGTCVVAMAYSGGSQHVMSCTFEAGDYLTEHYLEVIGTQGRLRTRRVGDQHARHELLDYLPAGSTEWQSVPLANSTVRGHEFSQMWTDALRAIAFGHEPETTAENAARSVRIVHQIYEDAARVGTVVD